jgi:hypothetical protein
MNDLEAAHSLAPCRDTQSPREDETSAPITVYSRRETDENYGGREGDLHIVNCSHGALRDVSRRKFTTPTEYVRRSLLAQLERDGICPCVNNDTAAIEAFGRDFRLDAKHESAVLEEHAPN